MKISIIFDFWHNLGTPMKTVIISGYVVFDVCLLNIMFSNELKQQPKVFCKKDVLKNYTKFIGKLLCQSLFFNQVAG